MENAILISKTRPPPAQETILKTLLVTDLFELAGFTSKSHRTLARKQYEGLLLDQPALLQSGQFSAGMAGLWSGMDGSRCGTSSGMARLLPLFLLRHTCEGPVLLR